VEEIDMEETTTRSRTAVVVDPDPLWHNVLTGLLSRLRVQVAATGRDVEAAPLLVSRYEPDLLVLEPGPSCEPRAVLEALRRAHAEQSTLTSIVVSGRTDTPIVDAAVAGGSAAFVRKDAACSTIEAAVASALDRHPARPGRRALSPPPPPGRLTRREAEILRLIAEGRSNREVARELWVTDQTVKFHLGNVYRKLGVANRGEARVWATKHGLVWAAEEAESAVSGTAV
jgi:DNA-binding NarL/FixJ family response regulator